MLVVYPRDEQERATLIPLFDACVQHSRSGTSSVLTSEAIELETADGNAYLVCFYEVPTGPSVKISHHLLPDFGNRRMSPGRVGFGTRYFLIFARLTRAALWMNTRGITRRCIGSTEARAFCSLGEAAYTILEESARLTDLVNSLRYSAADPFRVFGNGRRRPAPEKGSPVCACTPDSSGHD